MWSSLECQAFNCARGMSGDCFKLVFVALMQLRDVID